MALAAETSWTLPFDDQELDHSMRTYDDVSTWMAEALKGSMRTSFDYRFDGSELYARDGGALKVVFHDAIKDAHKLVDAHPNLVPELRRRYAEFEEYQEMLAMARGELPNTMVVISDFPPEFMDATEDIGGYNVSRKQTMLRVISRQHDGSLRMVSQTLDHSDRGGLEAIYAQFGRIPEPGELLGQRIHVSLSDEQQDTAVDHLMGVYDHTMESQYGGYWYAGRRDDRGDNTYHFVQQQSDLVEYLVNATRQDEPHLGTLRYNVVAAMQKRFEARYKRPAAPIEVAYMQDNAYRLMSETTEAGSQARARGQAFSGCGGTMHPETELSAKDQLSQQGFGNKTEESTSYSFNKKMHCVVCQAPPKKDEVKKWCGPCGICRDCDKKFKPK